MAGEALDVAPRTPLELLEEFCEAESYTQLGQHTITVEGLSPDFTPYGEGNPIQLVLNKMRHRATRKGFKVRTEAVMSADKKTVGLRKLTVYVNVLRK
jgi:hypothetical protein